MDEHNHAAFHCKTAVVNVRTAMKRRAEETEELTRRIDQQALTQVSAADAHLLPSHDTLSRDVRRHRLRARENDDNERTVRPNNRRE